MLKYFSKNEFIQKSEIVDKACNISMNEIVTFYFLLYFLPSIEFTKIFGIRFLMDLHVLRCPEHDLIIFRKCLSVCMSPKHCRHCILRANAWKLLKLNIQLNHDIIWYWLDWCISLKKFRCFSKILTSLTQLCRTKLRAIVPNADYFMPMIMKF